MRYWRGILTMTLLCSIFTLKAADRKISTAAADTVDTVNDELETSYVTATTEEKAVSGVMSGDLKMKMSRLSSLPKILGNNDLLKTIQLMPGIQISGEVNSGIYIRGAEAGHNLVLFDGAPVYNASHLLSFFSVFNSNHIDCSSLYKSNIPAEFGGRLSGVLDVRSKNELLEKVTGNIDAGLLFTQATIGIPLCKKSSIYVSGRGSYMNYMLKGVEKLVNGAETPEYFFDDFNLSWIYSHDKNNNISVNAYYGSDRMDFSQTTYQAGAKLQWHNMTCSARWESRLSEKVKMHHDGYMSVFDNHIGVRMGKAAMQLPSGIKGYGYRGKAEISFDSGRLKTGIDYIHQNVLVQYPAIDNLYNITTTSYPGIFMNDEFGIFADWTMNIASAVTLDAGIRYSGNYSETGKCFYGGFEPRLNIGYDFASNMRLFASYSLQRQYTGQVSVSGMGLPTDFWMPVTDRIKPQKSNSVSAGLAHSFGHSMFEYSIELYYRHMNGLMEFDGELFDMINQEYIPEDYIHTGKGRSYGAEMIFKKNKGSVTGWISYTIGRSERIFAEIMGGKPFPSKNDRLHNLAIASVWTPHDKWEISGIFIYATGTAFTMPGALYMIGENIIHEYGPHNGARMPDYHRLDLSVNYQLHKKGKTEGSINVSVYNVYARPNPLYLDISVDYDKDNSEIGISLVGRYLYSILPSIGYSIRF